MMVIYSGETSFLFSCCFFSILLTFAGRSLVCSFFFFGFLLGLERSFLLLHDLFVLFDGLSVHLNGSMAKSTIVSVPVLSHKGARATWRASLPLLGHIAFAINTIQCINWQLSSLVDMFVFLFSSIYFLLLFLLTSVKVSNDVDVRVVREKSGEVGLSEVTTLTNQTAQPQIILVDEVLERTLSREWDRSTASIKLVQPDFHFMDNILNIFD